MKAILGKKIGMTQIFAADGTATPVTVVEAGPCVITQIKNNEKDGYTGIQVAYGKQKAHRVNKAQIGQYKKAGVEVARMLKEFRVDDISTYNVGDVISCDTFAEGEKVDVSAMTKGHGFTGVIKRWNNHRLKMTHGTGPVHRHVGSMGACSSPSRVFKNKKMAGQYGNEKATVQSLTIMRVDKERNLLLIKGGIPGAKNCTVTITKAVKA